VKVPGDLGCFNNGKTDPGPHGMGDYVSPRGSLVFFWRGQNVSGPNKKSKRFSSVVRAVA
jgi:hypothetical protein